MAAFRRRRILDLDRGLRIHNDPCANIDMMQYEDTDPEMAWDLKLAAACKLSKVRQFIAKRVAESSK